MLHKEIAITALGVMWWVFAIFVFGYVGVYGFIPNLISFLVQHLKWRRGVYVF